MAYREYKAKRTRNVFDPRSDKPFKLSRSRLENFIRCPRDYYIDRRLGIDQPPTFPYTLNNAVDTLLKKEFDAHRGSGKEHPLLKEYRVKARPLEHPDLETWRNNFVGVQYLHEETNLIITGAVDDIWVDDNGKLIVVDYKATNTEYEVNLNQPKWLAYGRQMEVYQWLLRKNGHEVNNRGYFVYANANTDREAFDAKIEFDVDLVQYDGNDSWVEQVVRDAKACLMSDEIPPYTPTCDFCKYNETIRGTTGV